jgi:ubiquinone/menaquinone biosynthesis C-methylase UbiE
VLARKQLRDLDKKTIRKRELIELYDTTAAMYNKRYKRIQTEKYKYLLGHFTEKDSVLDVGCGTGLLIGLLDGRVASMVGVDLSTEMLRVASQNIKSKGIDGNLINADADSLPFRSNVFSKIVSVTLLQNMPDPKVTIGELARVLDNGGDMIITCLKNKYALSELRTIIASGSPESKLGLEWESNEEDVGVCVTKPI